MGRATGPHAARRVVPAGGGRDVGRGLERHQRLPRHERGSVGGHGQCPRRPGRRGECRWRDGDGVQPVQGRHRDGVSPPRGRRLYRRRSGAVQLRRPCAAAHCRRASGSRDPGPAPVPRAVRRRTVGARYAARRRRGLDYHRRGHGCPAASAPAQADRQAGCAGRGSHGRARGALVGRHLHRLFDREPPRLPGFRGGTHRHGSRRAHHAAVRGDGAGHRRGDRQRDARRGNDDRRRRPHGVRAAARPAARGAAQIQPARSVTSARSLVRPADLRVRPLARAETIPSAWYTDARVHALDRDAVFAATWQYVADARQLARPGDHIVTDVAEQPIIVVRGADGALRAFYNVCRHRGGPLAMKDGNADMLICKYHGWTYRLDGMLRGVPHFNRVELFDKRNYGLTPVHLAEWEGLVFVSLAERPKLLEGYLKGIRERIAPTRLGALRFARRIDYDVRANWKVYVDNYLEGYHVPYVHPELYTLYDYEGYVTEVHDWYSVQVGPLTGDRNVYTARGGDALYYQIFPNLMLTVVPGRLQSNVVLPVAPDRCKVVFRYYYDDVTSPAAQRRIEADIAFSDKVQQEDAEICERVQRGLTSRAYDKGRFSVRFEEGVYHFQTLLKRAYGTWLKRR